MKQITNSILVLILLGTLLLVQANSDELADDALLVDNKLTAENKTAATATAPFQESLLTGETIVEQEKSSDAKENKEKDADQTAIDEEVSDIGIDDRETIPEDQTSAEEDIVGIPANGDLTTLQPFLPGPKNPLEPLGGNGEKGENWEKACQGGTCTHKIYNYAKYYQKNGLWQPIDENFYSSGCQTGHDFCVIDNLYQAHMKSYLDAAAPLTLAYGNLNVGFSPLQLSYRNNDQQQRLTTIRHSPSQVTKQQVLYPAAFGNGVDMRFSYLPKMFKEDIIIRQRENIPVINISTSTDTTLDLEFQLSLPSSATALVNNQPWDKQTKITTQKKVVITQGTAKLSLPSPFAVDAKHRMTKATYVLEARDNNVYITMQVPYSWLTHQQRVYPVLIDPTIILGDTANQFDGSVSDCPICLPDQYARYPSLVNVDIGQIDTGLGTIQSTDRATIDWDVSSLPSHAQIVDINLTLNFTRISSTDTTIYFHHMEGNNSYYADDNTGNQYYWDDLGNGTVYHSQSVTSLGFVEFNLSNAAADLQSALRAGSWWSLGMKTDESNTVPATDYLFASEEGSVGRPTLEILYTSTKPVIDIISPLEGSLYDRANITISVSVTDADNDFLKVSIFGATPSYDGEDLLLERENVSSGTILTYSWEAPVLDAGDAALLMHFDNRSEYGEDDDTFNDFSPNNNDGSCNPGECPASTIGGKIANAFTFTSPNHYITLPNTASLDITSAITLAAWIKTNTNALQHIIGGYQATSPFSGYSLAMSIPWLSAGKVAYWSDVHGAWVEGNTAVADDQWHHVAVTVSGTTATFYVDGNPDGVVTSAQPGSYQGIRAIGGRADGDSNFTGMIDEVLIVPRALSEEDIKNMYRLQSGNYVLYVNVTDGIEDANSGPLNLTVFADEFEGRKAIERGITNAFETTVGIFSDQLIYTRDTTNAQQFARFDTVTLNLSKRWGINYITPGESFVSMNNLSTTVYTQELINLTGTDITQQVKSFIQGTA